jgi:hypothetical protein
MDKIFPMSIVGSQAYDIIMQINDQINALSTNSTIQYYLEEIVQIVASAVAIAATGGAGGDMIVSAFFTVRHGIAMSSKIIGMIDNIKKKLVVDFIDESGNKQASISPETVQFLGDFFNIDFEDGPEGVECWVKAIFRKYRKQQMTVIMCDIISEAQLFETLGQFIANFIASSIPDAGYLVKKSIEKLMQSKMVRKVVMMNIMKRFKKNYKKIPKKTRLMIQKPELFEEAFMEKYLLVRKDFTSKEFPIQNDNEEQQINIEQNGGIFRKIGLKQLSNIGEKVRGVAGKGVGYVIKQVGVGDQLFEQIDPIMMHSKLIAYTIHKMLALSYAILCILKKCP